MRILLNDLTFSVNTRGNGIPLLLIHGYPLNNRIWEAQIDDLDEIAHTIAFDLRGHGDSDGTQGPYSMDMHAADCRDVLDALGVDQPAILCGLSMGGYIAFSFFRNYPERVAGLILAATRAGADTPEGKASRDKAIELAKKDGPGSVAETMLAKMLSPRSYNRRQELVQQVWEIMGSTSLDGIIGDLEGMKDRPSSVPTLGQIDRPTLILHGSDDQLIPSTEAIAMRAAIQGSILRVLLDAGHLLNMEQPELFNRAIRTFIQESFS